MLPNQILCAFLLTCFDKQIADDFCSKGCSCFREPNDEISAICESPIETEFKTKTISSLAFTNDVRFDFDKLFPVQQIVKNLIIINSKTNLWPELSNQRNLFNSIKGTQYLTLVDSYLGEWDWSSLANSLTSISAIYIEGCDFPNITSMFKSISTNEVTIISIVNIKFNNIEDRAFGWPNLKRIDITDNNMPYPKREWFAKDLNNLWSLDLHSNHISEIPPNFFEGMPKLKKLKLNANLIKTLKDATIMPVWGQLKEFWITDNLIECSKDLVWITRERKYPLFFGEGQCRHIGTDKHGIMKFHRANSAIDVDLTASQ